MKILHFLNKSTVLSPEFFEAVAEIPSVELEMVEDWESFDEKKLATMIQECDILIASRAPRVPDELAENSGKLKYICYMHGTMRKVIGLPIINSQIQVTNWGNQAGKGLGEGSFILLLAVFKDLHRRIQAVRSGNGSGIVSMGNSISQLNIGVYGFGFSGREFIKYLEPFGAKIRVFDPYVDSLPESCTRVDSLEELFSQSQAIVIHASLNDETEGSVSRELLAMLPDQGIVINTARGAIIDQEAFFDELRSGRLRAGVDVLYPDNLPEKDEARQWENLIWTCHQFLGKSWESEGREGRLQHYTNFYNNIVAFVEGNSLEFTINEDRYLRMT